MTGIEFAKGHGTENDFVILNDPDGRITLSVEMVSALCDRRRGLGADGVLRVATTGALVRTGVLSERPDGVDDGDWFMDYRNADGSIAEMCGNGVRVFAHYLRAHNLVDADTFVVGSRAGARPVTVQSWDGERAEVTVSMGAVTVGDYSVARVGTHTFRGIAVDVGNPHLACVADDFGTEALAAVDFEAGVTYDHDAFPAGVNVEILTAPLDGSVEMRVYERGSGETRSCGTGTVAAVAAALDSRGESDGEMTVRVPGGQVRVVIADGTATLTGPSELVASGHLSPLWGQASST